MPHIFLIAARYDVVAPRRVCVCVCTADRGADIQLNFPLLHRRPTFSWYQTRLSAASICGHQIRSANPLIHQMFAQNI